ncbi:riboflavin kinase [Strigomonas culicis]|uniref:riboflavin kinase n=1 Tax=Strigomonas culicis TaxID=28005 RepID=S9UJE9_9TRYP|nr:riboflavin kinase [Strigomonas culicis]EPY28894.1 riboflavin kinase [Strigomonas culicis]EPY33009.1 riboflavin kinase [Strigomonas culicis]EPY34785.1 riboflavin kinase [Strigomonas culicis]|eukprot:EPY28894.1 riboflavin kinase [Strigomonas culicis]
MSGSPFLRPLNAWYLRGKVVHGHGRGGTQLGFPTANLELDAATIQSLKKYSNLVLVGWGCVEGLPDRKGGPFPFAMSVGKNPHFKDVELTAEVYFIHKFESDFYGAQVRILCLGATREQAAFTTLEDLIKTIEGDVRDAERILALEEYAACANDSFVQPLTVLTDELNVSPYYRELSASH